MNSFVPRRRGAARAPVSLAAVIVAAVVLTIPLMHGGLAAATLPVLSLLAGLAFLAAARRALFAEAMAWREAAPWVAVWAAVSVYLFAQSALREWLPIPLTLNGNTFTRVSWLAHLEYWSFFTAYWLLAWTVSRQARAGRELIVVAVMLMALFQALYGLFSLVGGAETILGIWPKTNSMGSVSGTFYNRNHLAGLLAVAMPLGAAWLLSRHWDPRHHRVPVIRTVIAIVFLLATGAALIGTASRLGIFAALSGFAVWAWLYSRGEIAAGYARYAWLALLLVPIAAGTWFGPDYLIERLLAIDQSTGRLRIWAAMLDAPFKVWLYGVGAGSFQDVFKLIHPFGHAKSVWRAHSEYLQWLFEFGLIGLALLAPVFWAFIRACRPARLTSLQRGAFAGVVAILVHNLADFDMQIPGTAVFFWIAFGLLFAREGGRTTATV